MKPLQSIKQVKFKEQTQEVLLIILCRRWLNNKVRMVFYLVHVLVYVYFITLKLFSHRF